MNTTQGRVIRPEHGASHELTKDTSPRPDHIDILRPQSVETKRQIHRPQLPVDPQDGAHQAGSIHSRADKTRKSPAPPAERHQGNHWGVKTLFVSAHHVEHGVRRAGRSGRSGRKQLPTIVCTCDKRPAGIVATSWRSASEVGIDCDQLFTGLNLHAIPT